MVIGLEIETCRYQMFWRRILVGIWEHKPQLLLTDILRPIKSSIPCLGRLLHSGMSGIRQNPK